MPLEYAASLAAASTEAALCHLGDHQEEKTPHLREIEAWTIPERFVEQRYTSVMHGVGMHGETPFIAHSMDFAAYGREGVLEPGMVVSGESYIGEKGGQEALSSSKRKCS
jgi:Xaa-Pro aminopeptidase